MTKGIDLCHRLQDGRQGKTVGKKLPLNETARVKAPPAFISKVLYLKPKTGLTRRVDLEDLAVGLVPQVHLVDCPPERHAGFRLKGRMAAIDQNIESSLTACWQELLGSPSIGLDDDFFDSGGDSVIAARLFTSIRRMFGVNLALSTLFEARTVRELAAILEGRINPKWSPRIAPLKPDGSRIPFLCVDAGPFFRPLTQRLAADQPFLGLRLADTSGLPLHFTLQDIAEYHLQTIREFQPSGPYCLGGWSAGGLVAYEVAQRLRAAGEEVQLLILFDVTNYAVPRRPRGWKSVSQPASVMIWRLKHFFSSLNRLGIREKQAYVEDALKERYLNYRRFWWRIGDRIQQRVSGRLPLAPREPSKAVFVASERYNPKAYGGRVLLFRSAVQHDGPYHDRDMGWRELLTDVEICDMPGDHDDMFLSPHVDLLAKELEGRLSSLANRWSVVI